MRPKVNIISLMTNKKGMTIFVFWSRLQLSHPARTRFYFKTGPGFFYFLLKERDQFLRGQSQEIQSASDSGMLGKRWSPLSHLLFSLQCTNKAPRYFEVEVSFFFIPSWISTLFSRQLCDSFQSVKTRPSPFYNFRDLKIRPIDVSKLHNTVILMKAPVLWWQLRERTPVTEEYKETCFDDLKLRKGRSGFRCFIFLSLPTRPTL